MSRPAAERREDLLALYREARGCTACPLSEGRTQVVFGNGNADADLAFVGEAPGYHEDQQGLPFVGRAGRLLDELLVENGMSRESVFVMNVLKCLRGTTQVQLADGSWERIRRLVRSRYAGEVMSVDPDGSIVPRRVIGWHASPVAGRSVYRLTYRSAKRVALTRVGAELTGDHPVLTDSGYVPAAELRSGDRIATGQGLSDSAHDVVCGTLLGDGCLANLSAHLSFGHSRNQLEYALFKAELLEELQPRVDERQVAAVSGGARSYPVVHVRTLASRALGILQKDFYRPKKVVPPWIADTMSDRMLAIWFLDDGHTQIRPTRRPRAEIATVSFSDEDLQMLLRGLRGLGLAAKASRGRLYFDVAGTEALSERIAPYVPPSMRYKLDPDVEARIPFDPDHWKAGARGVLFDEVDVEVTDRARPDRTFFCIDVEGTHNFVTAGGVVHNCQPPGNRDPQPEEIETCRPYLDTQVELIEPRVICTLGNFATKLLTRSGRGITQVRGRPQTHTIGGRSVRIYPLLHPAAALRTARVKEQLREDFSRLPALLAESVEPRPAPRDPAPGAEPPEDDPRPAADQLGLFG